MRTPLILVTGIDPVAMDTTLLSLAWDLPDAVVVRHRIDPETQVLTRTVSDAHGVVEQEHTELEHACLGCALREDIAPTIERLVRSRRWRTVVSGLPVSTEAHDVVHAVTADPRLARHLRLAAVVHAAGRADATLDLLTSDQLRDRGLHLEPDDDRGIGEVACAQVELADLVVVDDGVGRESLDLVRALARPGVPVLDGSQRLDGRLLVEQRRDNHAATAWASPELQTDVPLLDGGSAWRLELSSPRPFHPDRLLDHLERLADGPHRSRGSFWTPTRPEDVLEWSGAGGQLSIGCYSPWGRRAPRTRLVLTGLGAPSPDLVAAFDAMVLTGDESADPNLWSVHEDGLEPWLGDIRDAA